jgi:ribulose bisphosphate carboxylase small subunit
MAIADEMKRMTENIIDSHNVRVKALRDLVTDTHRTLKGFAGDRKKTQQSMDLAGFVNDLSKNVQSLLKQAQNMVGDFHKDNKQMGKEQAKNLAGFVNDLNNNVRSMLSAFDKNHREMSKELKHKLATEIKDIKAQVQGILDEADKLVGEHSSEMAQAKRTWEGMSATLGKARKGGVMQKIEAGKDVSTAKRDAGKSRSKNRKQRVPAGV